MPKKIKILNVHHDAINTYFASIVCPPRFRVLGGGFGEIF
jgi:hypothetical protein